MKKEKVSMQETHNHDKFELERKVKEAQRNRIDLETEVRNLENGLDRESK